MALLTEKRVKQTPHNQAQGLRILALFDVEIATPDKLSREGILGAETATGTIVDVPLDGS